MQNTIAGEIPVNHTPSTIDVLDGPKIMVQSRNGTYLFKLQADFGVEDVEGVEG